MLGIGVGTYLAHRLWRHLWLIEAGIGACAIGLAFCSGALEELLFATLPALGRSPSLSVVACVVLLSLPTLLIGCSLPLFAGYLSVLRKRQRFARAYALYNVGAAVTALAIEFWLLRELGVRGALLAVAGLNISVALMLRVRFDGLRSARPEPPPRARFPARHLLALALAGVGSAVFQLLMIKIGECLLGPYHETFALVLAVVLGGIAVGSILTERLALTFPQLMRAACVGLLFLLGFLGLIARGFAVIGPHVPSLPLRLGLLVLLMGVPAAAFGATVPALLRAGDDVARDSGQLLLVASLANAAGFLLMVFGLHARVDYGGIAVLVLGLAAGALLLHRRRPSRRSVLGAVVACVGGVVLHGAVWDEGLLLMGHGSFESWTELKTTRDELSSAQVFKGSRDLFAITWSEGQPQFFFNGYSSFPLESGSEHVVGAFSSLFAPRTDRALVLGVGSGITAGVVAQVFDRTDTVEINPTILDNLYLFTRYNFDIQSNPSVRIVEDDASTFVRTASERYSLILSTVTTPRYFSSSKLYTLDFFARVRERLEPDGVYATWIDSRIGDRGVDIILETLRRSFGHCAIGIVRPGYFVLLCSDQPLSVRDPARAARSKPLAEFLFRRANVRAEWLAYGLVSPDAFSLIGDVDAPLNTLDRPALEFAMTEDQGGFGEFEDRLMASLDLGALEAVIGEGYWDPIKAAVHVETLLSNDASSAFYVLRWKDRARAEIPQFRERHTALAVKFYADLAREANTAVSRLGYGDTLVELRAFGPARVELDKALDLHERAVRARQLRDPSVSGPFLPPVLEPVGLAQLHFRRGVCRQELGELLGAEADYSRTIELEPKHSHAWNNMGTVRRKRGNLKGAIAAYDRVLEIDHLNKDVHFNRGTAYLARGDNAKAIDDFTSALDRDPANARAALNRAIARFSSEDLQGAIDDCRRAEAIAPGLPLIFAYRGMAHAGLGRREPAIQDLERFLELAPNHPQAEVARQKIAELRQ